MINSSFDTLLLPPFEIKIQSVQSFTCKMILHKLHAIFSVDILFPVDLQSFP